MVDFLTEARRVRTGGDGETAYQLLVAGARNAPSLEMWGVLGQSLHEHQRFAAAVGAFKRGDLGNHETLVNLGWCLHQMGRSEEALPYLRRATELAPLERLPWADLSQAALRCGELVEALAAGRMAALRAPEDHSIAIAHTMALFGAGLWEEGFRAYEARIPFALKAFLDYPYPRWDGGNVGRLLVQAEMGIGDCIWALRWIEEAADRVETLILFVHAELLTLVRNFARRLGNVEVYAQPRELPEADAYVPMLSLPNVLGMGREPCGEAYLANFGGDMRPIRRVGIFWASGPKSEEAKWRDIPIEALMPLLEMPEIEVHSLQMGDARLAIDQLGLHAMLRDRSAEISNFYDTYSIMAGLDLVIGCDSAPMHLAGAMGKRAWMLRNKLAAPWVWPWDGGKCPWYDSVEIMCRERNERTWEPLIERVVERLRDG